MAFGRRPDPESFPNEPSSTPANTTWIRTGLSGGSGSAEMFALAQPNPVRHMLGL